MYLFCYIGIEAILFTRRIALKNQLFLKSLYENRTNRFAKRDIVFSLIFGMAIIVITKLLDGQPQNLPTDYYEEIFHTIVALTFCIIAITFHIHSLAKYIFVECKKQMQPLKKTTSIR